jgi:hypothetical protein
MSNLIHNEQMKMSANFYNNLGVAVLVGGFILPATPWLGGANRSVAFQFLWPVVGLVFAFLMRLISISRIRQLRE